MPVCMRVLRAGNAGLDSHCGESLIFMEPNLHMAVETQAVGRIHRFGQTRSITIHYLAAEDTAEPKIRQLARDGSLTSQGTEDPEQEGAVGDAVNLKRTNETKQKGNYHCGANLDK